MPVTTELSDTWVRAYGAEMAPDTTRRCSWHPAGRQGAAVGKIADRIAFHNELVDITADGVRLERPLSAFSQSGHRPGS